MVVDAEVLRRSWHSWSTREVPRQGPYFLQLVWTGLSSVPVALLFTLLGFVFFARDSDAWTSLDNWWYWFKPNLFATTVISYAVHVLLGICDWAMGPDRLRRFRPLQRRAYAVGVPMLGVLIGWPLAVKLAGYDFAWTRTGNVGTAVGLVLFNVLISVGIAMWFEGKARRAAADRREAEAQLKLLQAQIEPHFLFNTLANVLSLIDADAPRAKRMLETFIDYLRASLARLRRDESTLGAELDMAESYLQLLQLRMDDRLRFRIEADAAARAASVPPLLLQPLVENAIHHGLEPKVDGGEVVVRARREHDMLVIEVDDDGLGLDAPRRPGHGVALANIRERLAVRRGAFSLLPRAPGVSARITLPYQAASR